MKRLVLFAAITTLAFASGAPARAAEGTIGLGFRSNSIDARNASELRISAPLGVRCWLNQQVGIDLGFGLSTHKNEAADENATDWSIEGGIPWCFKSWDKVHVILRPGVNYTQQEDIQESTDIEGNVVFTKIKDKFVTATAELEAEVFLADNVSVSASSGIGLVNYKPGEAGAKATTDFATFGRNPTQVGFHVYLWGAK